MDSIRHHSAFAAFVAAALRQERFTVVDVGCGGGLPPGWRSFGDRLAALGIDAEDVSGLAAAEANPQVRYLTAFADGGTASPARNNPWARLAVQEWRERHGQMPGVQTAQEKPKQTPVVSLTDAVREAGLEQVDFLKIDVDGPDFGVLQSAEALLAERGVLGVGVEVNFIGTAADDENSFHNTDRLLRRAGFDLFDLSTRRYSSRALPGRSRLAYPAETGFGRHLQGDAVYFRDLCAPYNAELAATLPPERLAKLSAAFALFGLIDCAAEVLVHFRPRLEPLLDVAAGLNLLAADAQAGGGATVGYETYRAAFAVQDPWFRFQAASLRPDLSALPGEPSSAYAPSRRVLHGAAACEGDAELSIITGEGRWSFAVEFPLDRSMLAAGDRLAVTLQVEVEAGSAGIGALDRSRASFHEEAEVVAGEGPRLVSFVTPAADRIDALMVRNLSPDGAPSRLRLAVMKVARLTAEP